MNSFAFKVDPREAQYARLVFGVVGTLREAVARRSKEGLSKTAIAARIGRDKSALSRVLNGRTRNLTLKTVSDILWACEFEPIEFDADALEDLSANHVPDHLCAATALAPTSKIAGSYGLTNIVQKHRLEAVGR